MAILLGRALTLEGAFDGLAYMVTIQPERSVSLQGGPAGQSAFGLQIGDLREFQLLSQFSQLA